MTEGVLSGTPIATPAGWRPVEQLSPGDLVLTFEDGPVPLIEVWSQPLPPAGQAQVLARAHWPLAVPVAALGNRMPIRLLPEQRVLIESDSAEEMHGDPFALLPAAALEGFRGIEFARPEAGFAAFRLGFTRDQIVYAGRGALIAAPAPDLTAERDPEGVSDRAQYPTLTLAEARALVACLMAEDLGAALRPVLLEGHGPQDDSGPDQAARF